MRRGKRLARSSSHRNSATKSTVSFSISSMRTAPRWVNRASVYRIDAGRIAIHRTEVSLAFDQYVSHRPSLCHMHERGIDCHVAVRVIVTHRFADDLGAFAMFPIRLKPKTVHRIENSALRRFQSVSGVRKRARNDDRHRVVEKRLRHLFGDVYRFDFFIWMNRH